MTSSKDAPRFFLAHSKRFTLLASRIIWQYAVPRLVQPRQRRPLDNVFALMETPLFSTTLFNSFMVVSSSSFILLSICPRIVRVSFLGRPDFVNGLIVSCEAICFCSRQIVCRQGEIFSFFKHCKIWFVLKPSLVMILTRSRAYIESLGRGCAILRRCPSRVNYV